MQGGLNLYAYNYNNPVCNIDPIGLYTDCEKYFSHRSKKEFEETIKSTIFSLKYLGASPKGIGISPTPSLANPTTPPIRPGAKMEIGLYKFSIVRKTKYLVTQIYYHYKVICKEKRKDECGNIEEFTTDFDTKEKKKEHRKKLGSDLEFKNDLIKTYGETTF